ENFSIIFGEQVGIVQHLNTTFFVISAYFRRSWFCSRRLSVFERGAKIQSDFCPTLIFLK
ncbi:hypothetical protein ACFJXC_06375, partial [Enterococcus faecalis]